jgi:hypothetical protein
VHRLTDMKLFGRLLSGVCIGVGVGTLLTSCSSSGTEPAQRVEFFGGVGSPATLGAPLTHANLDQLRLVQMYWPGNRQLLTPTSEAGLPYGSAVGLHRNGLLVVDMKSKQSRIIQASGNVTMNGDASVVVFRQGDRVVLVRGEEVQTVDGCENTGGELMNLVDNDQTLAIATVTEQGPSKDHCEIDVATGKVVPAKPGLLCKFQTSRSVSWTFARKPHRGYFVNEDDSGYAVVPYEACSQGPSADVPTTGRWTFPKGDYSWEGWEVSPNGKQAVNVSETGDVWLATSGGVRKLATISAQPAQLVATHVTEDGKHVLLQYSERSAFVINIATGKVTAAQNLAVVVDQHVVSVGNGVLTVRNLTTDTIDYTVSAPLAEASSGASHPLVDGTSMDFVTGKISGAPTIDRTTNRTPAPTSPTLPTDGAGDSVPVPTDSGWDNLVHDWEPLLDGAVVLVEQKSSGPQSSADDRAFLYRLTSEGKIVWKTSVDTFGYSVAVSPRADLLVHLDSDSKLTFRAMDTGKLLSTHQTNEDSYVDVSFVADGKAVLVGQNQLFALGTDQ